MYITDIIILIACLIIIITIILLGIFTNLLRDSSTAIKKPYSYSRVQLAWWTVIIICSYIYLLMKNFYSIDITQPQEIISNTALILLGISAGTTAAGSLIDTTQKNNEAILSRHQDEASKCFLVDILSDENGISIHRFQTLIFNFVFGVLFIYKVMQINKAGGITMPDFSDKELLLMGISSGAYTMLKSQENAANTDKIVG